MKKINFCKDWRFGEAGDGMQSVLLPHDATQQQGRAARITWAAAMSM